MKPKRIRYANINVRIIPADLKAYFKSYCARRNCSMEAAVVALIRYALEEDLDLDVETRKYGPAPMERFDG